MSGSIIHLSFGPQANELNSAFYNKQKDYFIYSKEDLPQSHIDPNVRFVAGREYTPRAIFWDYRNGFGNWQHYNANYESPQSQEAIADEQSLPVVKHEIRNEEARSTSQHSSWTSRLKVPVHPSSMLTIPDWEIDYETAPFGRQRGAPEGQNREFDLYDEGEAEFKECQALEGGTKEDYMDTHFRPVLEKCDLLDGVNLVTDLGGWSGFTASFLETMRDEYLAREPVFTWCISRNYKPKWHTVASKIEALDRFSEFSSLVIPFQDRLVQTDFVGNAQKHLSDFETTCLLSSLRRGRISMHALSQDLRMGVPAANIIQIGSDRIEEFAQKPDNIRNTVEIYRGSNKPPAETNNDNLIHDRSQNFKQYWYGQPEDFKCTLELNDAPLQLRKLISRANHKLREQVYELTEPYVWGWNDELSDYD